MLSSEDSQCDSPSPDSNCSLPPAGDEYLGRRQAGRFGVGEGGAENVQL